MANDIVVVVIIIVVLIIETVIVMFNPALNIENLELS
jgi:hypothetical protein